MGKGLFKYFLIIISVACVLFLAATFYITYANDNIANDETIAFWVKEALGKDKRTSSQGKSIPFMKRNVLVYYCLTCRGCQ